MVNQLLLKLFLGWGICKDTLPYNSRMSDHTWISISAAVHLSMTYHKLSRDFQSTIFTKPGENASLWDLHLSVKLDKELPTN